MIRAPAPAGMAGPPPEGDARLNSLWSWYNRQEGMEPLDAAKVLAEGKLRRDLDPDRRMEKTVQASANLVKTYSKNLKSTLMEFRANASDRIPPDAAAYCRMRYADGRTSRLLKWHYCLVLHLAEGGSHWLARAVELMLQDADRMGDCLRASSYIISAYNLDCWHGCGLQGAVLASALKFVRERPHNAFSYQCARIVADLEADTDVRAEVQDMMIRAARAAGDPDAGHCRGAAGLLADKRGGEEARRMQPLPPRGGRRAHRRRRPG